MEDEKVLGYIDNLVSFGIVAPHRKSLIITNKSLILVDANTISAVATSVGISYVFGVFGRGLANKAVTGDVKENTKDISSLDVNSIMNSDKNGIKLDFNQIKSIDLNRKGIVIKSTDKTLKYKLGNPEAKNKKLETYTNYVNLLKSVLSDKLTAK